MCGLEWIEVFVMNEVVIRKGRRWLFIHSKSKLNNMSMQNLWALKCKNDMKKIICFYINDVFFLLVMS
jgi:hypothetical protein